jgi:hypothetical protein
MVVRWGFGNGGKVSSYVRKGLSGNVRKVNWGSDYFWVQTAQIGKRDGMKWLLLSRFDVYLRVKNWRICSMWRLREAQRVKDWREKGGILGRCNRCG